MLRVRADFLAPAIDNQISRLKCGLPDQDFVAEHNRLLFRFAAHNLEHDPLRDASGHLSPIRHGGHPARTNADTQLLRDRGGDHGTNRSRIDNRPDL